MLGVVWKGKVSFGDARRWETAMAGLSCAAVVLELWRLNVSQAGWLAGWYQRKLGWTDSSPPKPIQMSWPG